MPFPMKPQGSMKKPMAGDMKKPVQDDLEMDLTSPHSEPDTDTDEDLMDSLSQKDIFGGEESEDVLGGSNPLEDALMGAGYQVTPEQLAQIEAIVKAKPAMGAKAPMGAVPGKNLPAPKAMGGVVPSGVKSNMLTGR